jgi:hypothetical protein
VTEVSILIAVFLAASAFVYFDWARRVRSGWFREHFGPHATVGLEPGEQVIGAWAGERYFGPLVPGSERTLGSWIWVVLRNLVPGRHWLRTQPALALRGAPLWIRVTDRGRLVVTIPKRWPASLRPRVMARGSEARHGFEPLLASGPAERATIRPAAEAFPGQSVGHFNRPDRQLLTRGEPDQLVAIEPPGGRPLVAWVPEDALGELRHWSMAGGTYSPSTDPTRT